MTDADSQPEPGRSSRRTFLAAVAAGLATACQNTREIARTAPPVPGLETLLAEQSALYPQMEAEDLYKLLYQATLGPSWFFIGNTSMVVRNLLNEIRAIEPALHGGEQEFEPLCPERGLVRVNLRPFLKRGGKADELVHALCLTTQFYRGDLAELESSLASTAALIPKYTFACEPEDFSKNAAKMKRANYRPGVHSEGYALTYRPAYRIIVQEYLTDPQYGGRGTIYPS